MKLKFNPDFFTPYSCIKKWPIMEPTRVPVAKPFIVPSGVEEFNHPKRIIVVQNPKRYLA